DLIHRRGWPHWTNRRIRGGVDTIAITTVAIAITRPAAVATIATVDAVAAVAVTAAVATVAVIAAVATSLATVAVTTLSTVTVMPVTVRARCACRHSGH